MSEQHVLMAVPPVAPGEVLRERVLSRLKITQDQLADAMGVSRLSINQIINGRRSITAEMALRLSYVTSTTPEFWLNLQRQIDLYEAQNKLVDVLPHLKVLRAAKSAAELIAKASSE
jgi:addiction module HigA family antidote